jgi:hypothetical protein
LNLLEAKCVGDAAERGLLILLPLWAQWLLVVVQIIAALAVPVLVWYAIETHRLRKVAEDQSRVLVQPILAFGNRYKGTTAAGDAGITYENVGRGPAYRIEFEERHHQFPTPGGALPFSVRLEALKYIKEGQEVGSRWQFRTEQDPPDQWTNVSNQHRFHLGGIPNQWVFPMRVTYEDVVGRVYEQTLNLEILNGTWIAYFTQPRFIRMATEGS